MLDLLLREPLRLTAGCVHWKFFDTQGLATVRAVALGLCAFALLDFAHTIRVDTLFFLVSSLAFFGIHRTSIPAPVFFAGPVDGHSTDALFYMERLAAVDLLSLGLHCPKHCAQALRAPGPYFACDCRHEMPTQDWRHQPTTQLGLFLLQRFARLPATGH
jgi:hypothetical protein